MPATKKEKVSFLYVTFPNAKSARAIASKAVESRLAACANVLSPHTSIYRWKGRIESSKETIVIFKTAREKSLRQFVSNQHPYEVPCIATLSLASLNPSFRDWVIRESARPLKR